MPLHSSRDLDFRGAVRKEGKIDRSGSWDWVIQALGWTNCSIAEAQRVHYRAEQRGLSIISTKKGAKLQCTFSTHTQNSNSSPGGNLAIPLSLTPWGLWWGHACQQHIFTWDLTPSQLAQLLSLELYPVAKSGGNRAQTVSGKSFAVPQRQAIRRI